LEKKESNQNQADSGVSSETSSTTSNDPRLDEEEELDGECAKVKLKERVKEKQERIEKFRKGQGDQGAGRKNQRQPK
jgi:hypothetical protein